MRRKNVEIPDLEEFDDVSEFYFEELESRDFFDRDDDQEEDFHSFRPISEL